MSSRIRGWIAGQMLVRGSGLVAGPPGCSSSGRISPSAAMSSTGTTTWSSSGLRVPASTIVDLAARPDAAEEPGDRLERPLRGARGRSAAAASASAAPEALEALEAQGEVGAALRAGDRVDLVDDDVLDAAEDLARLAREQQVERFGGRDEDVRRPPGDLAAVLGRRVAGPARDRDVRRRLAEALRPRGRSRRAARAGCARRRR